MPRINSFLQIVHLYEMAQPARESRKTPLSIEPFWERPTRWEKWIIQVKLAILARENITVIHTATTQANDSPIASGNEVRDAN